MGTINTSGEGVDCMNRHTSRRDFLTTTAFAGAGFWIAGTAAADVKSLAANDQINFACIGVGGKGRSDTADAARHGNVVAICDVDEQTLARAAELYPKAKKYVDYRKMLDEMGKSIDAVTVSTPDHTHAPASALAMRLGKHCFTQKPLTRSIYEARRLGEIAREMKVATQMGNQGTAGNGLRRAAALVRAGVVGTVKEVHVWTNRPIWPQGHDRPKTEETPPAHLHWDLWLGSASARPFHHGTTGRRGTYHDFNWRGWWDFGTGALGDMACHTVNMPFMALDLREPTAVEAEHSGHNKETYPKWSIIRFTFPTRDNRPALTMIWYDGGKKPPAELFDGQAVPNTGSLLLGAKGRLVSSGDNGGNYKVVGEVTEPKVDYPQSPGHFKEFADAIKGGKPAMSNFPDYAGPLTETILLGNLAIWAGKKVEWDARNMKATNAPEVEPIIRPQYRKGFTL
jgi:predicted dehydrogenase